MAEVSGALAGLALFLVAGLGLVELVPAARRLPLPRRLAYAYLFGLAGVGGSLWAFSHFLGLPLRQPTVLGLAAAAALIGLAARLSRRSSAGRAVCLPARRAEGLRGKSRALVLVASAAATTVTLGLFVNAVADPVTDWDGRQTWCVQAAYLRDAGTVDAAVLREPGWFVSHPRYPLLLPLAQIAVLEATDAGPDRQPFRAVYAVFFPVLLLIVWDGARRWAGPQAAALACLAATGAPALTFWIDGGAAGAFSDLPLAAFLGGALVLLLRTRRSRADAAAAGCLLAAAALTKNEGATLAALVLAGVTVATVARYRRSSLCRLALVALPVALGIGLLASWRAGIPLRYSQDYVGLLLLAVWVPEAVVRIPRLVALALHLMLAWEPWGLFWACAPLVGWLGRAGWSGRRQRLALALGAAFAAPLAVAWGAYLVHPSSEHLVSSTWNRFLVQGSVPALLLLALAARDILRHAPWLSACVKEPRPQADSPRAVRSVRRLYSPRHRGQLATPDTIELPLAR